MSPRRVLAGGSRWLPAAFALAAGAWAAGGCGGSGVADSPDAIDTGRFIDVYVELRMATLRAGVTQLPVAERDRILGQHAVSERDLLTFVEVYGRDAQFMHAVWDSIESVIDARRTGSADSTATPGSSGP